MKTEFSRVELVNLITSVVREVMVPAAKEEAARISRDAAIDAARFAVNERLEEISRLRWSVRVGHWTFLVRKHP